MVVHGSGCLAALCLVLAWCTQAAAAPVRAVVSFSILEDIVRRIGGGEVVVASLIGPDSDPHVFEPNPDQARLLAKAQLFVVNGLGFEGWLTRLTRSAQFGGVVVTATDGVAPITTTEPGETPPVPDPHAWQTTQRHRLCRQYRPSPGRRRPGAREGLPPAVQHTKPSSRRWTTGCGARWRRSLPTSSG